jgi:hypothetical protein
MAAENVQAPFNQAAGAQSAFAQGFGDALQALVSQGTNEQLEFLKAHGTPEAALQAVQQAGGNLSNIVYGQQGWIPGQAMTHEGAGWQTFMNQAPTFQAQQLQQDAVVPNRQLQLQQLQMQMDAQMHAQSMAAQAAQNSASGGSDGGLTAYQQYQVEKDQRNFDYQMAQDAQQFELELAKFEHDVASGDADDAMAMAQLDRLFGNDKTDQGNRDQDRQDDLSSDARARRAARAENKQKYIKELRAGIAAVLTDANPGMTKAKLMAYAQGQVSTQFDSRFGYGPNKIAGLVRNAVNSGYANYKAGWPKPSTDTPASGSRPRWVPTNSQIRVTNSQAFKAVQSDIKWNTTAANSQYQFATTRLMSALRSSNPQWVKKRPAAAKAAVKNYLASVGIRPKRK